MITTTPHIIAQKFPLSSLLPLATATFITSLTETLPAGVLPAMAQYLHVSASAAGQTVTIYALGTLLTAIPLTTITASWSRRTTLIAAMGGFAIANTITAITHLYWLSLGARFLAGMAAGLAWSLLAGYARRLAPGQEGRAIAIAMIGIPLALSLGVPAGTYIGHIFNWRIAFGTITILTLLVIVWILCTVPNYSGETQSQQNPHIFSALKVAGVPAVLTVTFIFVLAHTIIYAYITEYLHWTGLSKFTDIILLAFGIASLISIWITSRLIDHNLRYIALSSAGLVTIAFILFLLGHTIPAIIWTSSVLWGLGWGGAPTILQTAAAKTGAQHSSSSADSAQAMLVTLWNGAMAAGGVIGGLILNTWGVAQLPFTVLIIAIISLGIIIISRQYGFPASYQKISSTEKSTKPEESESV